MDRKAIAAAAIDRTQARLGPWSVAVVGLLLVPLLLVSGLTLAASITPDPLTARLVSAEALADDYGIRFDMVGVTAAGGLVDLRFTIVDAGKAAGLFHDETTSPALVPGGTDQVLQLKHGMGHRIKLVTGGRYFALFSNSGGHVQSGTPVSVVVGDVRIPPMVAQS